MVARLEQNNSTQGRGQSHLIDGFCPLEKSKLRYKQRLSYKMAQVLKTASDNEIIQALAFRLESCNGEENLFVGEDLHTADGVCFNGRGNLSSCGSRFCSQCVSRAAKINAKIADYVFSRLNPNYRRYIVLTMPDDSLSHLSWLGQHRVFYHAWDWLNTKSEWWKKYVRGVIRCNEFTAKPDRKNLYHYHSNLLADCVFLPHLRLKQEWARALKVAYRYFGIEWSCPTENGLPDVQIKRIVGTVKNERKEVSREKVISELCKYATKPQDWENVPVEDIVEIALLPRFPRMFEVTGSCKTIAKEVRPKSQEKTVTGAESTVNEQANFHSNLNQSAYVHTNHLSVPKIHVESSHFWKPPPKPRQKSWFSRLRDKEITFDHYKIEHSFAVERIIRFRKIQLRLKYPYATFQTLDGQPF